MTQGSKKHPGKKPAVKDLEPYRRLVDLQKQMIELLRKHEQSKRHRDALHEQVARELANGRPGRNGLGRRLQQSAAKLLKRVPQFLAESIDTGITRNPSSRKKHDR